MYDLSKESDMYLLRGRALTDIPIEFYGKEINYVHIKDIVINGEEWYQRIITPFSFDIDSYHKDEIIKNIKDNFSNCDMDNIKALEIMYLYCQIFDNVMMETIKESLKFFFGADAVEFRVIDLLTLGQDYYKVYLELDDGFIIDSNKFDELSEVIRLICYDIKRINLKKQNEKEQKQLEMINKIKDERMRASFMEILKRQQEQEKKESKRNLKQQKFYNLFNYINIITGGFNEDKLLEKNIYQFYNLYNGLVLKLQEDQEKNIMSNGLWDSKKNKFVGLYDKILK